MLRALRGWRQSVGILLLHVASGSSDGFFDPPVGPNIRNGGENPYGAGYWNANNWMCEYQTVASYDQLSILAFKLVAEGLNAYSITNVPATSPNDFKTKYKTLLINNQFDNGSWDDNAWVSGYPGGTGWVVSTLVKL